MALRKKMIGNDADSLAVVQVGFIENTLNAVPNFVLGLIGSVVSVAIAVVIVMKMGGFEPVVMRLANAYVEGFEIQTRTLAVETERLAVIVKSLESVSERIEVITTRLAGTERRVGEMAGKLDNVTAKVDTLDPTVSGLIGRVSTMSGKLDRLGRWACDHVDTVKTHPVAPDCPTK